MLQMNMFSYNWLILVFAALCISIDVGHLKKFTKFKFGMSWRVNAMTFN